jgi:N-acetylglucosaminyldiphosphoundecaprenol N-acetyl-beta-D-mannosaminyltransferase
MKLVEIIFYNKEGATFWDGNLQDSVYILPLHAEKWYLIQKQGDWDKILKEVDIFVADGVGLAWGYRFLTGKKVSKISGIDLIERLVSDHPETPTYIWGTTSENIERAAENYKKRGLNLVGFHDGYSGKDDEILAEIKKSGAKVVFVGMGPRRAAELCVRIKNELGVTTMTAGGSFDVVGGKFKRAPLFFQKIGLEWLWRMFADPKRLKRLPALIGFVYYVIKEKIKTRRSG